MKKQVAHCYLSPSGSTRKTGRGICSLLEERGYDTLEFDLARYRGREGEVLEGVAASSLLLIGSPVYANHAAGPVVELVETLPFGNGKPALAYVTYGGVSKGSSLYQLAGILDARGFRVLGLAEVLAAHSMMFRDPDPIAKGHPNDEDWETLAAWIETLSGKLGEDGGGAVSYADTRPPGKVGRVLDATVFTPGVMRHFWPPIRFYPEKCTSCGACQATCPVGRLDDLPRIDETVRCLFCYQCVRHCPEGAFDAATKLMHPAVRMLSRVSGLREAQATRFYA